MNFRPVFTFLVVLLFNSGCAATTQLYSSAPSELPATQRAMKTAGFWIARHPYPDEVILNAKGIAQFNRRTQDELKLTQDVLNTPSQVPSAELVAEWENTIKEFNEKGFYRPDGAKADDTFFDQMRAKMIKGSLPPDVATGFGFIVRYADQRILPTREPLYAKPGDVDFDELQNSTLDVGTSVAIFSLSQDNQWYYVRSALSSGWVEKNNIALTDLASIKDNLNDRNFIVVIAAKADIFLNKEMTEHYDYARMGSKFRMSEGPLDNGAFGIWVPVRLEDGSLIFKEGFMKQSDVNEGYLTYTARNILEQAFKLLNEPYGWGGMYGEQDCSAFLDEVFATVGIFLPRNSSQQRKTGGLLAAFTDEATDSDKVDFLVQADGGMTLLGLKGHIMLYLGTANGRPYAIHAVWAYREPAGLEDRIRVINRVAVTDLFLGEGSRNGSLLKRLKEIVVIK